MAAPRNFTKEQIEKIRSMTEQGCTQAAIAEALNTTITTIRNHQKKMDLKASYEEKEYKVVTIKHTYNERSGAFDDETLIGYYDSIHEAFSVVGEIIELMNDDDFTAMDDMVDDIAINSHSQYFSYIDMRYDDYIPEPSRILTLKRCDIKQMY